MKQTAKSKHAEALANQVIGIAIGWALVFWAFPFIGLETTATQATQSSAIFFVASYARHYAIRTFFDKHLTS